MNRRPDNARNRARVLVILFAGVTSAGQAAPVDTEALIAAFEAAGGVAIDREELLSGDSVTLARASYMEYSAGILTDIGNAFQERAREVFHEALEALQYSAEIQIEQESVPDNVIRFRRSDAT